MSRVLKWGLIAAMVMLPAVSANAFDGQRKGKILGIGAGLVPAAPWRSSESATDYNAGWSFRLFIGYAWNDKTMITLHASNNVLYHKGDRYNDVDISSHMHSLELTRYERADHRSTFWRVGIGRMAWGINLHPRTVALTIGGGYAFAKGLQIQLDAVTGPGPGVTNHRMHGLIRLELLGMIY